MPAMPDPTSECPIFGRMYTASQNPQNVENARNLLNAGGAVVPVGEALGVVDRNSLWSCGSYGVLNEAQYLEQIWFDDTSGWWIPVQPIYERFRRGLQQALNLSYRITQASGNPCPIKGIWICVDDYFEVKVRRRGDVYGDPVIWFAVFTPPPEDECTQASSAASPVQQVQTVP